mmetsp:Transcript_25674/g.67855  ORF Transcript_25674/g.67855 Transcript_25674/m.67855 type:complete len:364 (-) Transcript_25674:461-1552(-)
MALNSSKSRTPSPSVSKGIMSSAAPSLASRRMTAMMSSCVILPVRLWSNTRKAVRMASSDLAARRCSMHAWNSLNSISPEPSWSTESKSSSAHARGSSTPSGTWSVKALTNSSLSMKPLPSASTWLNCSSRLATVWPEICVAIAARAACFSLELLRNETNADERQFMSSVDAGASPSCPRVWLVHGCLYASAAVMREDGSRFRSRCMRSSPSSDSPAIFFGRCADLEGKLPRMITCMMTPMLHMSLTARKSPLAASGAKYCMVPTIVFDRMPFLPVITAARPKSMTLMGGTDSRGVSSSLRSTMTFSGFRSRWSTLWAWQYDRAPKTWRMMPAARASSKFKCLLIVSSISSKSSRPSMYSRTR